jgi:hypothetical protein
MKRNSESDCIFTDFQKFQRLVELSELIGTQKSMTNELYHGWRIRWYKEADSKENKGKKIFEDKDTEYQYYINMYKLVINYFDKETNESSMKWKVKGQIKSYLIKHSKQITSTDYWKTAVESGEIDANLRSELRFVSSEFYSALSEHIKKK